MGAHQDQFRGFAEYNRAFNRRIYAVASELSDDERSKDIGAFFGSIHGTLNHILLADRIWLGRFAAAGTGFESLRRAELVYEFDSLGETLYDDFDALGRARGETDEVIAAWVEELSDEVLAGTMRYANSRGEPRAHPLWLAVAHLFNHQTHHRGQVTALLSQLGKDPGVTDYIAYVRTSGG